MYVELVSSVVSPTKTLLVAAKKTCLSRLWLQKNTVTTRLNGKNMLLFAGTGVDIVMLKLTVSNKSSEIQAGDSRTNS